jgi:arylsulfatase A
LRGHKADLYEGGHRVPFVVRWPGKVKAGTTSDQLIGQFDFMATFAELVGTEVPATAGEDSVSFLPALLGTADKPIRSSIISQSINGSFAIRDGQWKLALCPGSGGWSFPKPGTDDTTGQPDFQLFNLESDPGEKDNLAAAHPDRVAKMKAALEEAIARGRTTPGPEAKNDVEIVMIKPVPPAKKKAKAKAK